jgi:hypothetical protein
MILTIIVMFVFLQAGPLWSRQSPFNDPVLFAILYGSIFDQHRDPVRAGAGNQPAGRRAIVVVENVERLLDENPI